MGFFHCVNTPGLPAGETDVLSICKTKLGLAIFQLVMKDMGLDYHLLKAGQDEHISYRDEFGSLQRLREQLTFILMDPVIAP